MQEQQPSGGMALARPAPAQAETKERAGVLIRALEGLAVRAEGGAKTALIDRCITEATWFRDTYAPVQAQDHGRELIAHGGALYGNLTILQRELTVEECGQVDFTDLGTWFKDNFGRASP